MNEAATSNIFGLLISGRWVRTDFSQIDATHFTISVMDLDSVNHIAVFLTGSTPFPDDAGGLVYFSWSETGVADQWQLLGSISNAKPSAIFKISHINKTKSEGLDDDIRALSVNGEGNSGCNNRIGGSSVAKIGISVEPSSVIEEQAKQLRSNTYSNPSVALEYTKKMLLNFYNYASSFVLSEDDIVQKKQLGACSVINNNPSKSLPEKENYIPLDALQHWYRNFERKLSLNPNFWKM